MSDCASCRHVNILKGPRNHEHYFCRNPIVLDADLDMVGMNSGMRQEEIACNAVRGRLSAPCGPGGRERLSPCEHGELFEPA